jgi:hypothetical protein
MISFRILTCTRLDYSFYELLSAIKNIISIQLINCMELVPSRGCIRKDLKGKLITDLIAS